MKKYIRLLIVGFVTGLVFFFGSIVTGNLGILGAEFVSNLLPKSLINPSSLMGLYLMGSVYSVIIGFFSAVVYKAVLTIRKKQAAFSFLFFG